MMGKLCSFVKLDEFAYDNTYAPDLVYGSAANKLEARVKALTLADDTGSSTTVYHTAQGLAWNQEVNTMVTLANTAADLGSGSTLDVSSFELDKLSPTDIKRMLTAVNASDLISDAVPSFVSKGFNSINLGTLTSYNTVNYAQYRLGQVVYGGADATSPVGSEIDNIYQVMNSLYNEGTHTYDTNMNDLTTFVKTSGGEAKLENLLRFIYKSHIFDTSLAGNYREYNTVDGRQVTAQGIMLYNSLGSDLCAYIARDADSLTAAKAPLDKMATLSKIVHIEQYGEDSYKVETKGLKRLIDLTDGQINATTFSTDQSVEKIKEKKPLILGVVETAYNATQESDPGDYKRSVFVSEFIAGVFNNLLENQYTKLATDAKYVTYAYKPNGELYSFGNDDASTLSFSDYLDLSVVERDGLEGILNSLDYIGPGVTASNMKDNRENIKACFTMMGRENGVNSHLAQALYLTEAHQYLKALRNPLVLNGGEMFVPVDETVADPDAANNIFSNTFSFKEYGERVDTFLEGAVITII